MGDWRHVWCLVAACVAARLSVYFPVPGTSLRALPTWKGEEPPPFQGTKRGLGWVRRRVRCHGRAVVPETDLGKP